MILYAGAQPSIGHRVLAQMVREGQMQAVITQNIDGLHHVAGLAHDDVIELHGNGTYAACLTCGLRHDLKYVRTRFEAEGIAPDCDACAGVVKSATISFGQAMPAAAMQRAEKFARDCDIFIVLGIIARRFPRRSSAAHCAPVGRKADHHQPRANRYGWPG